jgi:MFS family permease
MTTENIAEQNLNPTAIQGETKAASLISRTLFIFLIAMILANMGGNMYGPLLSLYLQDLGASVGQVGIFFTISQIIPLALQILGGWISDSLGRLRAIAMGSLAGVCAYIALLLAPTWQWVLLATGFLAITGSLIGPSFDAFIAEHSSEKNRARVFGVSQALFQIVSVVGPLLGGWLAQSRGYKFMLLIAACMYLAATLLRVSMARQAARGEESQPKTLSFAGLKSNLGIMFGMLISGGVITWILITDGVRDISFSLSFNFLSIYMKDIAHFDLTQIGLTSSLFGLFTMLSVIPGGWLADKKGERVGIVSGFVFLFAMMMIFIRTTNFATYCIGWAIAGIGMGLLMPAYQSLISKAVPKEVRGTAFGLFSTSLGLVSLPAPVIGAVLWEQVGPWFPFAITAWVCLFSIIPVWLKFKLPKSKPIEN